jgi:hypothetical protein
MNQASPLTYAEVHNKVATNGVIENPKTLAKKRIINAILSELGGPRDEPPAFSRH